MFKLIFLLVALVAFASAESPFSKAFAEYKKSQGKSGRIVGGVNSPLGRFPFMASLRDHSNWMYCGAVVVNNRWILSAAHCTVDTPNNGIRIVVGTVTLNSGGVAHTSSRIVNHPAYDDWSLINDISVVQTATVIGFNTNVQPAVLGSAQVGGGVNSVVIGWGGLGGGRYPNNLQQLSTTTLTNADCRARQNPVDRPYIFDSKICTFVRIGQGFCDGDSGGPLIANNQVIGIVIWTVACGGSTPDVYSRVSSFRNWIINNTS